MTTKFYDLSQLFTSGAAMWPRFAKDIQFGAGTFIGVHSTGWGGVNHPGWYDMGQGFPFNQGYCPVGAWLWWGHLHPVLMLTPHFMPYLEVLLPIKSPWIIFTGQGS